MLKTECITIAAETTEGFKTQYKSLSHTQRTMFSKTQVNVKRSAVSMMQCNICMANHNTWECTVFNQLAILERWKMVRENRLCFRCLGTGHVGNYCKCSKVCGIGGCRLTHDRLLHGYKESQYSDPRQSRNQDRNGCGQRAQRSLWTVPNIAKNGDNRIQINVLLDDGSTMTFIKKEVACKLGLQGPTCQAEIGILNGQT